MASTSPDFSDDYFGEPVCRMTRAKLIEDGTLTDVSALYADDVARAGITCPCAMSTTAYCAAVWPLDDKARVKALETIFDKESDGTTVKEIDVDHVRRVLFAYVQTARRRATRGPNVLKFCATIRHSPDEWREIDLKAVVTAGDAGEPVLTIVLADEN